MTSKREHGVRTGTVQWKTAMLKLGAVGVIAAISAGAVAAGDTKRGAQLFQQCMACHSVQAGEHMTGPSLAHAAGRKAGTGPGFQRYSEALKRSGVTWNDAALERARI